MSPDTQKRVLVVDDEANLRLILKTILAKEGYQVSQAANGQEGLDVLDREVVDFILCDVRMPVLDGHGFLAELKARGITAPVIMLSAYGSVDSAVEAIKAGAFDYVFKPFKPDEIILTLKKAEERERLKSENLALRRAAASRPPTGIVARSREMADLMLLVERVAQVKSPVLITGESGTGKELIARAIHSASERGKQPFVPVNCGAIPDKLLESELFGHVRGAFTDAVQDRLGLFREASLGTLFLDEIGELPPAMQVKLLRVLQFEEVRPVGATNSVKVDVRIVAATARDLGREVGSNRFREDLYYRLNVLPLSIKPLRERTDDIPPLLDHFLVASAARLGRERPEITSAAAEALLRYPWPGNVRELENLMDRILVMAPKQQLDVSDLPAHITGQTPVMGTSPADTKIRMDLNLKAAIRGVEAQYIAEALRQTGGNRSEASRRLGISYPSLLAKIKLYDIKAEVEPE